MFNETQYKAAIDALTLGLNQLQPDGNQCAICGDTDHQAWECTHNPLVKMRASEMRELQWRCFHCGALFDDADAARQHFGAPGANAPTCSDGANADLQVAFVQGAAWMEYRSSGGTIWQSDRNDAEAEAFAKSCNGTLGKVAV